VLPIDKVEEPPAPRAGACARVAAGAALAVSFALVSVDGAGQFAPAVVDLRAAEWQVAARTHVSGQFDEPASVVAGWPSDLTRIVVDRAIRRARDKSARAPDDNATDHDYATALAKGLLLHTDIAIAERTRKAGEATGSGGWTLLDARPLAPMRLSIHWGLGRVLAEAIAKDAAGLAIARAWYRAVGALYQEWADLGQLRTHLAAGAEIVSDDPVLLLYEATLHQGYADARVQSYVIRLRGRQGGLPNRFVQTFSIKSADSELGMAERYLRRALVLDPSLVEARIRLAHVLSARDKSGEAVALARQALASPLSRFLEYYAAMVLGRSEARLGHHAAARAAFERAVARYPESQAAQVALSHVGLTEGRTADGLAALVRTLGPDAPAKVEDPWSWYFRLHQPDAESCLVDLRKSVP
jgi:tetratricopeptide (TPR) repeat protein